MTSNSTIFAGLELSSGRKPLTFAALDDDLRVERLEKWDISEALAGLGEYEDVWLALTLPAVRNRQELHTDFMKGIRRAGFSSIAERSTTKQWLETNAKDCFHELTGNKLFPRRTLEGRLQRSAILYEQGLSVTDPIDIFEEITRYKLIQGVLPLENLPSANELDALVAAYLAWMMVNRPRQTLAQGAFVLPVKEQTLPASESLAEEADV